LTGVRALKCGTVIFVRVCAYCTHTYIFNLLLSSFAD
jgi:hypothetical protein